MVIRLIYMVVLFWGLNVSSQQANVSFKDGEWLQYSLSYSGFLKAGEAELRLTKKKYNGKTVFHAEGKGKTSTVVGWFFKVRDKYESYFDTVDVKPYKFLRDVYEGGHVIKRKILFNNNKAYVTDLKNQTKFVKNAPNVQDMISAFYYLRNYDTTKMKVGDELKMDVFFDGEAFPFKLKYLGSEMLSTVFGEIKTQIFRPLVQSGRVFKEEESVRVWVTADKNKVPVYIKASLKVGSVRVTLNDYNNLKHSLEIN